MFRTAVHILFPLNINGLTCRNEDAERDCSAVLTLSKSNAKGLFRRAQARVGMGKLSEAQEGVWFLAVRPNCALIILLDLKEAAKLEPANQSVKQELSKVAELIQQASAKVYITVSTIQPIF
jgi:hypothetical protein